MPRIFAWYGGVGWIQTDVDLVRSPAAVRRKRKLQSVPWLPADWIQRDFLFLQLCADSEHAIRVYDCFGRFPGRLLICTAKNLWISFPAREPDHCHCRPFSWRNSTGQYWDIG